MTARGTAVGRGRSAWMAWPATALYVVFFVVPLLVILVYSVGYKPPLDAGRTIGLDRLSLENYRATSDRLFVDVFWRTIWTAAIGTVLCLVTAFPVAYALATRVRDEWKAPILALLVLPFWTSFLLRTFAWRILLAGNGPVSSVLQAVGILGGPLRVLDTPVAVQLGVVYNYLPLMILPLFVALDRQDASLREASQDLGATPWQTFRQITLPLALPGIGAGAMLVFIPLAGEYVTPAILGGARGLMVGSLIATQFLDAQNWALGAAQAVLLVTLVALLVGCGVAAARIARRAMAGGRTHRGAR